LPQSCHRVALKVLGRYDDDVWLGRHGIRTWSSEGEWAVSYHGTAPENIRRICSGGYDTGTCTKQMFGPGIYSTPSFAVAESYAKQFVLKGVSYKMLLQNRVNLNSSNIVAKENNHTEADYFVTPDDKDIRPYGVCLKQV
ncbi:ubiquitin domain-containing, partial [Paramuricea clavata]